MARTASSRAMSSTWCRSVAEKSGLKLAGADVWRRVLKSDAVADAVLDMAVRVRDAANEWAESQPRSGDNPVERPHFEVVAEESKNRTRYTVRPASAYATWLVQQKPAEFMALIDAGRR